MKRALLLHEEILLLALRDREGTFVNSNYTYAMGGGLLAELLLRGRAIVDTEKKKKFLRLVDRKPLGEPLVDECIEKVATAKKRAQLKTWVERFSAIKKMKDRTAQEFCRQRVLREDEEKILIFFKQKTYPEVNPKPERDLLARLDRAIFSEDRNVHEHTAVLLSLAKSADLLKHNFDKKRLKERKRRIDSVINGEVSGAATAAAIEAMETAMMVAVILPTILATTTTVTSN